MRAVKQFESQSIVGQSVVVEGTHGKISGSFNATRLLALSTTNDAIEVSAQVHNAQPDQPTTISLKTTNGSAATHPAKAAMRRVLTHLTSQCSTREYLPLITQRLAQQLPRFRTYDQRPALPRPIIVAGRTTPPLTPRR